jgi:hypothetical protein
MHVAAGEYVFAVLVARASTAVTVQYFDHKTKLEEADIVVLAGGEERTDIHFQLY